MGNDMTVVADFSTVISQSLDKTFLLVLYYLTMRSTSQMRTKSE
jgi:hypothetical protein